MAAGPSCTVLLLSEQTHFDESEVSKKLLDSDDVRLDSVADYHLVSNANGERRIAEELADDFPFSVPNS